MRWTRLSCCRFDDTQVQAQISGLADNLGNFLRRLALPSCLAPGSMTPLREKLIKIGAKMVRHARCGTFKLDEIAVPRSLFATILAPV